ncbi:MAG: N-acetylmuramoyl-L-alanine amidase [Pseudomonadota bacterium]
MTIPFFCHVEISWYRVITAEGVGKVVTEMMGFVRTLMLGLLIPWLAPVPAPGEAAAQPVALGFEHGRIGDRIRLALSFDRAPVYDLFLLDDPRRLVLDFHQLSWQADTTEIDEIEEIAALRHGLFRPDRMRVVMDLTQPLVPNRVFLRETLTGSQLVIDLLPATPDAYSARAGLPEDALWVAEEMAEAAAKSGDLIVVIDPGHGGIDPGASADGLLEKDIVLAVGKAIAERIETEPGMTPVLTRDTDVFVPLRQRLRVARLAKGHVFISLHADAVLEGEADGISVYTLSEEASDASAWLFAERENRADVLAGAALEGEEDDVTQLLVDLARRGTDAESEKLATEVGGALRQRLDMLRSRPNRRAGFFVLKSPDIPSILIELGFLSSKTDRARMQQPDFAPRVANAMVEGIAAWMKLADPAYLAETP